MVVVGIGGGGLVVVGVVVGGGVVGGGSIDIFRFCLLFVFLETYAQLNHGH